MNNHHKRQFRDGRQVDAVTSCCRVYRNTITEIQSRIALQNDVSDGSRKLHW